MAWNEFLMARSIQRQVLKRACVVLVDRTTWAGHEADVLAVTGNLRLIDIEIKISRADLKADASKSKWWQTYWPWSHRDLHYCLPAPLQWPARIWKHYYALPADIWKNDLLAALPSPASGVILLDGEDAHLARVVRRSTPNRNAEPITAEQALDIARLANLRMWDAYAQLARASLERPGMAA